MFSKLVSAEESRRIGTGWSTYPVTMQVSAVGINRHRMLPGNTSPLLDIESRPPMLRLLLLVLSTALLVSADNWPELVTGQPALGAADFRPSPDRPVGYRGCQNGWFPGATPPLRFSDGTVTKATIGITNKWGKTSEKEVLTLADDQSVNIATRPHCRVGRSHSRCRCWVLMASSVCW